MLLTFPDGGSGKRSRDFAVLKGIRKSLSNRKPTGALKKNLSGSLKDKSLLKSHASIWVKIGRCSRVLWINGCNGFCCHFMGGASPQVRYIFLPQV